MSLLNRKPNSPEAWYGELPVTSRYTYGLAGERFFRALKEEGRIMGTHCPTCDFTYVPGRIFCERCMSELDNWVDVGTQGEVHTFTLLYKDYDGSQLDEPRLVAMVRIADGGLLHLLGEVERDEIFIGMPVEAVLKPQTKRQGSIEDIEYFRPV
ncbi:MAG: Zn-ribbon domain-containing OB-fold protein [Anaerolineales bacterium]